MAGMPAVSVSAGSPETLCSTRSQLASARCPIDGFCAIPQSFRALAATSPAAVTTTTSAPAPTILLARTAITHSASTVQRDGRALRLTARVCFYPGMQERKRSAQVGQQQRVDLVGVGVADEVRGLLDDLQVGAGDGRRQRDHGLGWDRGVG